MSDGTSSSFAIGTTTFNLPRILERPALKEIAEGSLAAIEPGLANMPLEYIQDGLKAVSENMLKVLRGIRTEPTGSALPPRMDVVVDDLSRDMPTHMLAVWSRQPTNGATRVTLYPTHHIVLAAHCATLPPLSPSKPASPSAAGETIALPIVPLGIPHAPSFPRLHTYLYNKNAQELLGSLIPTIPPSRASNESDAIFFARYSAKLAATFTPNILLGHALAVNGLWRNACALGIFDRGLWHVIDLAWSVLLDSLAISSGQADAVLGVPRL
ncbi:hypothetical protein B0H21DRAFT_691288 [Amylocystis lapponica]|nr:hypothetical protein B0H21DRAFT_691288 [Amylocystis lapponica]